MVINFNTALNQNSLTGGFLTGTTRNTNQTITGQSLLESDTGAISNLVSFNDYLSGGLNNPQSTFRNTHNNLIALGQASIDSSRAINEQIAIREAQRKADNDFTQQVAQFAYDSNARLSEQVYNLGNAVKDASAEKSSGSFFDGFPKLPTFSQLKTPLILAGAALAAIIILPRVIKSGFK